MTKSDLNARPKFSVAQRHPERRPKMLGKLFLSAADMRARLAYLRDWEKRLNDTHAGQYGKEWE